MMVDSNPYSGIEHVVRVDSQIKERCEHCDTFLGGEFHKSINHYLEQHGYKLLHVGSEAKYTEGHQYSNLVAILGH
jgi:hypothetical protein